MTVLETFLDETSYVCLVGTLYNGFEVYGPFMSVAEAERFGKAFDASRVPFVHIFELLGEPEEQ